MKLSNSQIKAKLLEAGLKITPQRMAILEAIYELNNHPTADNIIETIKIAHSNIATGTVYKILDTLVENRIIKKVKTEKDVMRYDGTMEEHHHLYCLDSDRIEDYVNKELNEMLEKYFEQKAIPHFRIEEIKLQIMGKFTKSKE
jgi:Fur family transcriptional regulator, peroxide stress response regulator